MYAKCSECDKNACAFVRLLTGRLTPFCADHMPVSAVDAYGTLLQALPTTTTSKEI